MKIFINTAVKISLMLTVLASFSIKAQQSPPAVQQQRIQIEDTIRGNQEQPKVMSIVPWQSPKEKQALPSLILQRLNKKFKPLERDEFQRQIQFFESYEKLHRRP